VESFNSRFSDEFLNIELFTSVQEAKLMAEQPDYPPALRRTGPANGIKSLR
jgi:hypothetical protein